MSLRLPQLALKLLLIITLLGQVLAPVQAVVSVANAPADMSMPAQTSHMDSMMMTGEHDQNCQDHCASHSEADCARHCASVMAMPIAPLQAPHNPSQNAVATASWSLIAYIGSLQTPPPDLA